MAKILSQLRRALDDDSLTPDDASKLAGRVAFLTQAVFGAVARAATKAIYARAADTVAWSNDSLSTGLAAALRTLVNILPTIKPRFVPFDAANMEMAVLYADAFFTERRHKAGHVPDGLNPSPHQREANGWGYVLRIGDRVFYDHGVVPPWFVKLFAARRAYIYIYIYIYIYARGFRANHRLRRLRTADAADRRGLHRQHGGTGGADEGLRQGPGDQRHDLRLLDSRRSPRLVRGVRKSALEGQRRRCCI